mmetsp:Transcript_4981/g.13225  ORF Transcript_4981/g.13225 Transcript_4981/m.13225 type:complete len:108 (+) Transcript_4981:1300-1623(+)
MQEDADDHRLRDSQSIDNMLCNSSLSIQHQRRHNTFELFTKCLMQFCYHALQVSVYLALSATISSSSSNICSPGYSLPLISHVGYPGTSLTLQSLACELMPSLLHST